ncbi:MAG: YggS family pyridoxal phosphate enzyme [Bacteroidetes bacterium GWF2_42_66]|nr:MAG: YggS family pyridoxal phosphate enzyme [Bacteroidetes bacterium GWA2_42_15]OFY01008.1 MAG: YggS family pyridoxal phosphate enzyme [Bacteroidetes bacterium GWE2_42_39]OFY41848.1 MAG: YggS family pyridoxal phosphate enzyme [Bacteroidetes bacterium GWF2_42_66]HBL77977.1 YggS family pyridoxal phosphate-dependent enzyme [Prolixibacteraceae bacterium]HCR90259.1 YggS family pyridoxal phosphate-dependent enzyme [Prolixibacteraceae bacterium]
MEISERIKQVKSGLPASVKLVAVSKTKPNEDIMEAYRAGQKSFGENKVQDLALKYEELPKDIEWHLIGHLQTNKVKFIAPFVSMIHAIDSLKLLMVIDKEAKKAGRVIPCLLQFHIAEEETKFGLNQKEAVELLSSDEFKNATNVRIAGVMGMATFTDDTVQVRREFAGLKSTFEILKAKFFANDDSFCEISMGMSDDYRIAVQEGSTMVRIGSVIFGARNYQV